MESRGWGDWRGHAAQKKKKKKKKGRRETGELFFLKDGYKAPFISSLRSSFF
jgi:hypothetical protein